VTNGTQLGNLRIYPADVSRPLTSVVNYNVGQTRAGDGIVPLGASGDFTIFSGQPAGTVDVIVDVYGYFR
jgi:hypothetical protein